MQWAIVIAAFLASAVEFVEAFTLVLVAGITTNWRSAILGALGAAAVLTVIVATLGVALVTYVPIEVLRFVVGFLLLLFGLKWLKNAIQRYTPGRGPRTRGTGEDRPRYVRGAALLQVGAPGRTGSGLHRHFLRRQRSRRH